MEYIKVTPENIDSEHICCAIAKEKDLQVMSKKGWMKERFADGLVFLKGNVRGKCFIEYIPAEKAWAPVEAKDYMYINCLWIAGKYKGQGYSNELLQACAEDAKEMGKAGLEFTAIHIATTEEAQNAPIPFTSFSLFFNGEFLTHEIPSEKRFEKIMEEVTCPYGV